MMVAMNASATNGIIFVLLTATDPFNSLRYLTGRRVRIGRSGIGRRSHGCDINSCQGLARRSRVHHIELLLTSELALIL
jgi:hypothetical protein